MKRFLTVAVAMLALTGMGQVAMRKLEDLTNTNLVCVTDYGPQVLSLTQRVTGLSNNVASLSSRVDATNALFSAWFSGLQSRTSYWDTAYGWGDWSVAVASNTAAIRILETNTVTRADTNGWEVGSHASFLTSAPPQSVVSVNGQTGAVVITAESIGALTNETDLAALRAYHYGSPDIIESPADWFVFDAGTITAFNWAEGRENVVIPWEIGGVAVTVIGYGAFQESGIVSVIAPQTVTSIGSDAFYYCTSLTSINLPQATSIDYSAFYYCTALASVTIPQATSIGYHAFSGCHALTAVHMGQNAPAEATAVFYGITPPPKVYVTNPNATGWGETWNGAPVVRPGLHTDALVLNGTTYTNIPTTDVSGLAPTNAPVLLNPSVSGGLTLRNIMPTNLVLRLVCSNEHIYVEEVYP